MIVFKNYMHNKLLRLVRSYKFIPPFIDVGCGTGEILQLLNKRGIEGIDFSENAVKICRQKGLKARRANFMKNKKKYNSVICVDVIEHIKDDVAFINALNRSLNKNGKLFLLTPSGKMMKDDVSYGHYRRYQKDVLAERLEAGGFQVEHVEMFGYPFLHYARVFMNAVIKEFPPENMEASTKKSSYSSAFTGRFLRMSEFMNSKKLFMKFMDLQDVFSGGSKGLAVIVIAKKL